MQRLEQKITCGKWEVEFVAAQGLSKLVCGSPGEAVSTRRESSTIKISDEERVGGLKSVEHEYFSASVLDVEPLGGVGQRAVPVPALLWWKSNVYIGGGSIYLRRGIRLVRHYVLSFYMLTMRAVEIDLRRCGGGSAPCSVLIPQPNLPL